MKLLTIRSIVVALIAFGCSFLRFIPIIGTYASFFSSHNITSPVAGLLGGPISIGLYYLFKIILGKSLITKSLFGVLFNSLSSIIAHAHRYQTPFIQCGILILCMLMFIAHPIGMQTPCYMLYWLIPLALIITQQKSIFSQSLMFTFTAHALGSNVWLYTKQIDLAYWQLLTLSPFVLAERLSYALGITACYYLAITVEKTYKKICTKHISIQSCKADV